MENEHEPEETVTNLVGPEKHLRVQETWQSNTVPNFMALLTAEFCAYTITIRRLRASDEFLR